MKHFEFLGKSQITVLSRNFSTIFLSLVHILLTPMLSGFSDDEASKPKSPVKSKKQTTASTTSFDDDLFPEEKATSALDNLLNGSSSKSDKKTKKPTMLEQMMSGKKVVKGEVCLFLF